MRRLVVTAITVIGWAASLTPMSARVSEGAPTPHIALVARFLEGDDTIHDYRALRRLEAENEKFHTQAWLEAWTELTASGFRYEITGAGGSDYVRRKVLEAALNNEQRLLADGDTSRADLTRANYEFGLMGESGDGLVKVALKPRRADQVLVDGAMFLHPKSGDLVRVEGALAKAPSFWTRRVDIVREYRRIAGMRVPVRVESIAQVKIAGLSHFVMTYDYQRINGQVVGAPGAVANRRPE